MSSKEKYALPLLENKANSSKFMFAMMVSQLFLSYALLIYNTVSSDGDTVFVQTGASVQLDIQTEKLPAEFDFIAWKNEKSDYVVKYINEKLKPHSSYINRVDFNTETFSLTLKNMQKTDSGIYTAIANAENDINIAEHKVSVIDAVKAPVLTVNSIWSSTEPCNFTCTADIITITSTVYNRSSCSEDMKSSGIYNLNLKCTDDIIICNHSNPVSWKKDTKTLQQLCAVKSENGSPGAGSVLLYWLISLICISLAVFGVVCFCFYKNKKVHFLDAQQGERTVYAEVEENQSHKSLEMKGSANAHTVNELAENEPDVTSATSQNTPDPDSINQNLPATKSKTKDPVTVYSTVQRHPIPMTTESDKTIYAMINKPSAGYESVH